MLTSCLDARARKDPITEQVKGFRQTGYETVEFHSWLYRDNANAMRSRLITRVAVAAYSTRNPFSPSVDRHVSYQKASSHNL